MPYPELLLMRRYLGIITILIASLALNQDAILAQTTTASR